jgi:HAD superfamily hydrolase (TIGR01509 family)
MTHPPSVTPPSLAAIVFDLDGVLIDSEAVWDDARRTVVAQAGGHWQPAATRAMMGMSSGEWSRYLHEQLAVPLTPEEINGRVVARVLDRYRHDLPLLPGAVAAVNRLADTWPLGLASSANRPVIDTVLERSGLAPRFAATVSSDEVARGKPAPDVYLAAARKLNVDPAAAAAVEDSTNGLRSGAAAGMLVIAVPNRDYPPEDGALALADLVVPSLEELTPALVEATAYRRAQLR